MTDTNYSCNTLIIFHRNRWTPNPTTAWRLLRKGPGFNSYVAHLWATRAGPDLHAVNHDEGIQPQVRGGLLTNISMKIISFSLRLLQEAEENFRLLLLVLGDHYFMHIGNFNTFELLLNFSIGMLKKNCVILGLWMVHSICPSNVFTPPQAGGLEGYCRHGPGGRPGGQLSNLR